MKTKFKIIDKVSDFCYIHPGCTLIVQRSNGKNLIYMKKTLIAYYIVITSICIGLIFPGCGDILDGIRLADCVTEATHLKQCRDAQQADNPLCVEHAMKTSSCQNAGVIDYQKVAANAK